MKLILVIAFLVQLSLADESLSMVQPPNDKVYPIFDLIATKMQEYRHIIFTSMAEIANDILPEYNKFMETHTTKEYEDFDKAWRKLLGTVVEFAKDPQNCQLENAVFTTLTRAYAISPADDDFNEFFDNYVTEKRKKPENVKKTVIKISEQLPTLMKNFIESLNDEEKQKYAVLYQQAEAVLKAPEGKERFLAIQSFMTKSHYDENLTEANDENCKWYEANFKIFYTVISQMT